MKKLLIALLVTTPLFAAKPLSIKGSDTMVIMNARLAEAFMAKNPAITIQVTGGGSGVGIAALINGTTDVAASSRPIKTSEVEKLKARFATVGYTFPIARDGLSVYLNTVNPVKELTLAQIRDIYTGKADVIVCDGFIGNVALKVSEGLVDIIMKMLRESLEATTTRKLGYLLSKGAYRDFKKRVDYSEIGGAPLLGVKGVCIICKQLLYNLHTGKPHLSKLLPLSQMF